MELTNKIIVLNSEFFYLQIKIPYLRYDIQVYIKHIEYCMLIIKVTKQGQLYLENAKN